MVRHSITRLAATLLAFALVASFVAAPVAATPDDGGIDIGGDDGITVGEDGVSVGGDDGVSVGEDGVAVGNTTLDTDEADGPVSTDDGVDLDATDGVTTDGVTDTVTAGVTDADTDGIDLNLDELGLPTEDVPTGEVPTDDLPEEGDLPTEAVPTDEVPSPDDGLPEVGEGTLPTDELPEEGDLPSPGEGGDLPDAGSVTGVVDSEDGSVDTGAIPVLETLAPVLEQAPAGELSREFDESDFPAGTEDVLGPVPFEAVPADPRDLPVGSSSAVGCAFPVRGDDLPLQALPEPDQLPVRPTVPGVPTSLLTPEAVGSIALGIPPEPCTAYDPDDPSLDPTDPPEALEFERQNFAGRATGDRVVWVDQYDFETEEGQEGQLFWSFLLSGEKVVATEELAISDGRTEEYVGLESRYVGNRDFSDTRSSAEVILLGSGVGGNLDCDDPVSAESLDPERVQNGDLECEASPEGLLQPPLGPEEIADLVQDPPITEEPPVDPTALPFPIEDLLNL